MGNSGQQWTTIGNNGQQLTTMDNKPRCILMPVFKALAKQSWNLTSLPCVFLYKDKSKALDESDEEK